MSSRSRVRSDAKGVILSPKGEGSGPVVRMAFCGFLLLLLTMCAQPSTPPPTPPDAASGPRVVLPDGAVFHVELATDDQTRGQGLMFRDRVREKTGMLFLFPTSQPLSFWMKNTIIPLDIVFMDETGRVVDVQFDVPPCRADPCPGYPANAVMGRYVLEVGAGVARQHGIGPGSVLKLEGIENVVVR